MGWWEIKYWRLDKYGNETHELENDDLEHIAECIKEGNTSGEVNDAIECLDCEKDCTCQDTNCNCKNGACEECDCNSD